MSNTLPVSSERFKMNLLTLLEIVNDMFEEGIENKIITNSFNIMNIFKLFIAKTPSEYMLKRFIKRTHPHWEKIKDKDIDYFKDIGLNIFQIIQDKGMDGFKNEEELSSGSLLQTVSGDHIASFKKLMESSYEYEGETVEVLDEDRREDIWKIMQSFVKISIKYIHETRKKTDGKYTVEFFPEISVKTVSNTWGVNFN